MTSRGLAWRRLAADPARAALAVAAVAIIGALLFNMLLLSRGLLLSFRDLLESAGGDVQVMASSGLLDDRLPIAHARALAAEIAALPDVQDVAVLRFERARIDAPEHPPADAAIVGVAGRLRNRQWRLASGSPLPEASPADLAAPVVVSGAMARTLGLRPGSPLRLRIVARGGRSALPAHPFRVVGVADFGFDAADQFTAGVTLDALERAEGVAARDLAHLLVVSSRPSSGPDAAVAAIARLRPDLHAYSNDQVVAAFNENGFAYFRQISLVLSSITLGFTFLLLATLLTVSVNQRLSEVAALRALGFPRARIAANLLWESALLVGAGGLLALPIGGALAAGLDRILRTMPGLPERLHFFVFEPRALVLHAVLLAASGLAAAAYPIWIAARLPIAATLRRETVS